MHHQVSQNQSEVVQPLTSPQAGSRSQRWTQIRCLCDAIAGEFHPEKLCFGSYAYDTPRPDSDVDLLVIMPFEGSPFRQAAVILAMRVRTVGVLPMDLLVRTAEQVQERCTWATALCVKSSNTVRCCIVVLLTHMKPDHT